MSEQICAYCGKPAEGKYSVHRDSFRRGPEVPLCNACGGMSGPSLDDIWEKIGILPRAIKLLEETETMFLRTEQNRDWLSRRNDLLGWPPSR